jgi:hypothetical protein
LREKKGSQNAIHYQYFERGFVEKLWDVLSDA